MGGRYTKRREDRQRAAIAAFFAEPVPRNLPVSAGACWALLRELRNRITSDVAAEDLVERALAAFSERINSNSSPAVKGRTNCMAVSAMMLLVYADWQSDRGDFGESRLILAMEAAGKCRYCRAELRRWQALVSAKAGLQELALEQAKSATRLAMENGGASDHNLYGNSLASCHYCHAGVLAIGGDLFAASEEVQKAISLLDPQRSPVLYGYCLHNLASYLVRLNEEPALRRAEVTLDAAWKNNAAHLPGRRRPSLERAMALWLRGLVKGRRRRWSEATRFLTAGRRDLIALNSKKEVTVITGDLARAYFEDSNSCWEVECCIRDLMPRDREGWLSVVPPVAHEALSTALEIAIRRHEDLLWPAILQIRNCIPGHHNIMPPLLESF